MRASANGLTVRLERGDVILGKVVVVATEGPVAAQLTGAFPAPAARGVTCLYSQRIGRRSQNPSWRWTGRGGAP